MRPGRRQGGLPVQSPVIEYQGLASRVGPPPAVAHAELGHHPGGGEVARQVAGGQGSQVEPVERERP